MSSIFCVVSFVKDVTTANKFTAGTAIYRSGDDDLIEEIWKKNIVLIVTFNQYIPLNIFSLGDEPTIYDLPIAPAFGFFSAPIQDSAITENGQGIFCLKKDVYNGVTGNQSSLSILCKYPLHTRHNNVADATTRRPIFSVGGELNYLGSSNTNSTSTANNNSNNSNNKRKRHEDLERIAEKFNTHPSSNNNFNKNTPQRTSRDNGSNHIPSNTSSEDTRFNHICATMEQIKASGSFSSSNLHATMPESNLDKGKGPKTYSTNTNINAPSSPMNIIPTYTHNNSPTPRSQSEFSEFSE
ncbi:1259_t:CDS:2 [Dentiscutata erythropus]|uniref:1259_t:CDS:1 n=1 Tax=Dentiscutata erythropus TaxID=1348616 RepID=A0A9N9NJ38_9GLOM|nr:1259_t:CDS:2 [Dentiscutata erythropus]